MINLRISNDKDEIKEYELKASEIMVKEDKLILKLNVGSAIISYEVRTDTVEPSIEEIERFLRKVMQKSFTISEFIARDYITICNDNETKRFTASKK